MRRARGPGKRLRVLLLVAVVITTFLMLTTDVMEWVWPTDWSHATGREIAVGAPIGYVAHAVGSMITVGSPEYELAVQRAAIAAGHVKNTREYQIDLDRALWRYERERHVREFLVYLDGVTDGAFAFLEAEYAEEYYHRYSLDTKPRTFAKRRLPLILRIRDYLGGHRMGLTTVDMKFRDGNDYHSVASLPADPARAFIPELSSQKIEQDVHACDVRWSRASRVFCDGGVTLDTIDDVEKLFPRITSLSKVTRGMPMASSGMDVYYWQMSHTQLLESGLKYKSTFTLMYPTLEAAMNGNARPLKDGEWSLRLWSGLEGFGQEFLPEHQTMVDTLFKQVVTSRWNSDEDVGCLRDAYLL